MNRRNITSMATIPEELLTWQFTEHDRALWGDAANIGDTSNHLLIDTASDSRPNSSSRALVLSTTANHNNNNEQEWGDDSEMFSETAFFLQRFRDLTQGRGAGDYDHDYDQLDLQAIIANGIVPPPTFASETERYEWARLALDTEALRPTIVKSPEEIELEKEIERREALRTRPRPERYLEHLLHTSRRGSMDEEDLQRYERFRRSLLKMLRRGVKEHMRDMGGLDPGPSSSSSSSFSLSCVGSLRYGQALQSSEMDLLFTPHSLPPGIQGGIVDIAENLLAEQGLLVIRGVSPADQTTPVLKVAASDTYNEIIRNQRRHSDNRDMPALLATTAAADRDMATQIFEASTASGYRCNIFFPDNQLMEHSANLLQCYSLCDPRVKQMGHFIKKWARARNICCPAQGTLCAPGYLYLLIHYLRDVADPPVLPNLQTCNLGRRDLEFIDGQEVHYWSNKAEIAAARDAGRLTQNTDTVHVLLRGFFEYYCGRAPEAPCTLRRNYFYWKEYSLILRSDGGAVSKDLYPAWERDTTRGRDGKLLSHSSSSSGGSSSGSRHAHSNAHVRIQDAIDTRRNIGASVSYSGLQRMRDEFARARLYIKHAVVVPGTGWGWQRRDGSLGEGFFDPVHVPPAPAPASTAPSRPSRPSRPPLMTSSSRSSSLNVPSSDPSARHRSVSGVAF